MIAAGVVYPVTDSALRHTSPIMIATLRALVGGVIGVVLHCSAQPMLAGALCEQTSHLPPVGRHVDDDRFRPQAVTRLRTGDHGRADPTAGSSSHPAAAVVHLASNRYRLPHARHPIAR
jgi:hypothetical protein